MVDSAFSEWDKAVMFNYLQQAVTCKNDKACKAEIVPNRVSLKANFSLLLSLSIIPAYSGVGLIA